METRNKALLKAIEQAQSVLLVCHVSPDGDTLGSALALRERLTRMGLRAEVAVDGDVPVSYRFLPGWELVKKPEACQPCELMLSVDVSSIDRMGALQSMFLSAPSTALIDHHPTNPGFAALNVIDGHAPAVALMVWRLFVAQGLPINETEAVCLYTGLSTDTGNFIYESTDAECFLMMSQLLAAGLKLSHYSRILFRQKSLPFERALAQALLSLELGCDGQLAGVTVTLAQLKEAGATAEHTDGIIDYAIDLEGVQLGYFLRENEQGGVKASLRALEPYRVDEVASRFGGGGHRLAAGCTLNMPMAEARQTIVQALSQAWSEQTK